MEKLISELEFKEGVKQFLLYLGEEPDRIGLSGTPDRIFKMIKYIFRGYDETQKPTVTVFENGRDGVEYKSTIIDFGYYFSFCEHHIIPFFGQYYYGYIPDKLIVGASKISRIVDFYSAKLQIQERLCTEIIDYLESILHPKGSILIMRGRHLCKEMRGTQKFNSPFETNEVRGFFDQNKDGCKDEFLMRISS